MVPAKPILSGDMISELSLVPNPLFCSVSLSGFNSGDQITVYDTNGRTVLITNTKPAACRRSFLTTAGFYINV